MRKPHGMPVLLVLAVILLLSGCAADPGVGLRDESGDNAAAATALLEDALECPYEQMRDRMLASLRGSGAFRRFKDVVYYLGIRDDWFAYRTKRFSEIAEQWCIQNGLL